MGQGGQLPPLAPPLALPLISSHIQWLTQTLARISMFKMDKKHITSSTKPLHWNLNVKHKHLHSPFRFMDNQRSFIHSDFLQRIIGLSQKKEKKRITFLFHCFSFSFLKIWTVERVVSWSCIYSVMSDELISMNFFFFLYMMIDTLKGD